MIARTGDHRYRGERGHECATLQANSASEQVVGSALNNTGKLNANGELVSPRAT